MDASLNIVELIETNPITRLSTTYQNKLLIKIKSKFTDVEQQMFVASFYCFLNYNQRNDFVIDLDDVWKWIGFSTKQKAKILLEHNFILDIDYKNTINSNNQVVKQKIRGGQNKELFMLNVRTFKLFCLKAATKKAEQIHEYYINLEEIFQEVIQEESDELKLQLEQKETELENQVITTEIDKIKIREKTLIEQFPTNMQCVYYGIIDNVSNTGEKLIKFGNSNSLKNRIEKHRKTYLNFRLINAFKVENKLHIENALKQNEVFSQRQRTITISDKKYVELLNVDCLTFDELDKTIKDIIISIEHSPENYIKLLDEINKLMNENKSLKKQLDEKNETNNTGKLMVLTAENTRLKTDIIRIIKKLKSSEKKILNKKNEIEETSTETDVDDQETEEQPNMTEIENCGVYINACKRPAKNKEGKYNIQGKIYDKLFGTRQDVWDGNAYKTVGCLIKNELMISKDGKIISKKKCIQETENKRFEKCGVNHVSNI
jgi:hypothetical protein